jgi:hypothetical protein
MSNVMEFLAKMLPKVPEPTYDKLRLIPFQQQPIRRYADEFAMAMPDMPKDREELQAALWVFGERIAGEMERRMNAALKLADDALATRAAPSIYVPATVPPEKRGKR